MNFDFTHPHTLYVLACYALGVLAYGGLLLHSLVADARVKKKLQALDKDR